MALTNDNIARIWYRKLREQGLHHAQIRIMCPGWDPDDLEAQRKYFDDSVEVKVERGDER